MSTNTVTALQVKSFDHPDEKRRPLKSVIDVVKVGDNTVGRFTFEPGWTWSECIKPIVKTEFCEINHLGFCLSGSLNVRTPDGITISISAGDAFAIPAGHEAWVTSDEHFVAVEVMSAASYARPPK